MSDYQNLVARLRKMPTRVQIGGSYERDCFDAATAIETLLRERDELRDCNMELQNVTEQICIDKIVKARDAAIKEMDEARAAEIEAKEHEAVTATFLETCTAQRDAAIARAEKAELQVTEYELARDAVLCELGRDLNAAETDRDTLRALLREAHGLMRQCGWQLAPATDNFADDEDLTFRERLADAEARIDAALKGEER